MFRQRSKSVPSNWRISSRLSQPDESLHCVYTSSRSRSLSPPANTLISIPETLSVDSDDSCPPSQSGELSVLISDVRIATEVILGQYDLWTNGPLSVKLGGYYTNATKPRQTYPAISKEFTSSSETLETVVSYDHEGMWSFFEAVDLMTQPDRIHSVDFVQRSLFHSSDVHIHSNSYRTKINSSSVSKRDSAWHLYFSL